MQILFICFTFRKSPDRHSYSARPPSNLEGGLLFDCNRVERRLAGRTVAEFSLYFFDCYDIM